MRIIPGFDAILNFRDYGGYPVAGEGRLVTGKLFRSGHHNLATPADLDFFASHDVATIIDLRGDNERILHPCRRHETFTGTVVFEPGETAEHVGPNVDPHDKAALDARMEAIYRIMPFMPALSGTYRLYLQALIDRPGGSMIHCFAGKDRTGIGVALVHHLAGVHHDDMVEDYLSSNDSALLDRRIEIEADWLYQNYGPLSDAALRAFFGVEASYLDAALDEMAKRYGSVDGYCEAVLGVTPEKREKLRAALIV
jgi:protein tyrosine/serine phosphatase